MENYQKLNSYLSFVYRDLGVTPVTKSKAERIELLLSSMGFQTLMVGG